MGMRVSCENIDQILRCQIIDRFELCSLNFLIDKIINGFPTQFLMEFCIKITEHLIREIDLATTLISIK